MLHIVAVHLEKMGLKFAVIDGTVNPKRRMDLVEEFNTNPKGPQVYGIFLHIDITACLTFPLSYDFLNVCNFTDC